MLQRNHELYDAAKRIMDATVAAVGLVVTAPVQLVIAGLVLVTHGRPVLFRQPRPGRDGAIFELVKFRSMLPPDADRKSDSQRLTSVGRLLRSSSLDELPTLWNVLKGDMSLVGPRPLRTHYLPLYTRQQSRRHEVRPGVTGLAQISGRNLLSWEDRFALDVEYVDSRSLSQDIRIMRKTIITVFRRKGISAEGQATMSPFTGTSDEK